jgi:uncharacterized phage protein gp47/JayE
MSDTTLPQAMLDLQSDQILLTQAKAIFSRLVPNMDMSEQNFPHHMLAPFCLAVAQLYVDLEDVERRTSLATAMGADLDRLGDLYGVDRTGATKSTGTLTFTGAPGSVITQGYAVTTGDTSPITFQTTTPATLIGTTISVPAQAALAGANGNVGATTIIRLTSPVPAGITAVTNAAAFIGGLDEQIDGDPAQFLTGYRADIQNLSAARGEGGASKHLRKWARSVAGVGGVRVIEATPSPGWVTIALVGSDKLPVSTAVALAVEDYLLDPWRIPVEAELLTISGFGGSLDTQGDGLPAGTNNTVKFSHSASGAGVLTGTGLAAILVQPGIWRLRVRAKRGASTGSGNCLQFGVWDTTAAAWCKTTFSGSTDANTILTGAQLAITFADYQQDFAWFGINPIELHINRMTPDVTTDVWIDQINYWSTMSRDDRDQGLTPAGMRLLVQPATPVTVNIAADLTYGLNSGQTIATVQADLHNRLVQFFADLALIDDNDVRRSSVEDVIYATRGIADVSTVTLNTSTANIAIALTQVAVLGTETWT